MSLGLGLVLGLLLWLLIVAAVLEIIRARRRRGLSPRMRLLILQYTAPWGIYDPATWSNRALANYQRARSSAVTITRPDGSSETVSPWEMERRRQAKRRRRKQHS